MIKRFVQWVSLFPFAGKAAIRPAFRNFIKARRGNKTGAFGWLSGLLGFLIFGHSAQALRGLTAIRLAYVLKVKWFWHVIFVGYTAANIAVTIAQIYILGLCAYYYFTQKRTRLIGHESDFTFSEVAVMLVVTLGGQFLFLFAESYLGV